MAFFIVTAMKTSNPIGRYEIDTGTETEDVKLPQQLKLIQSSQAVSHISTFEITEFQASPLSLSAGSDVT
jgi:hypothetical protein